MKLHSVREHVRRSPSDPHAQAKAMMNELLTGYVESRLSERLARELDEELEAEFCPLTGGLV